MFDRLDFLIGEALVALRRNSWMTFASVSTAAVAIFLLGSLAFAYRGVSGYAQTLPGILDMRVFLVDGVSQEQISATAARIRKLKGVEAVYWIPREKAWEVKKKEDPNIPADLENPYPHSFKVVLKNIEDTAAVQRTVAAMPTVAKDGVVYLEDLQQLLTQVLFLLRTTGIGLGGIMLLTSGVLIYNAIRLTIMARRTEIRIMHLVGATRATVVLPLLIEGILQGAAGGLFATGLLWVGHSSLASLLVKTTTLFSLPPLPLGPWATFLIGLGAAYGLVCSVLAVREPMNLRWLRLWRWSRRTPAPSEGAAA